MVSFSCEECGDVLTKKKLDQHKSRCRGATFSCIDCMTHFPGFDYRSHTSCMTEEQKYQGAPSSSKKVKTQATPTTTPKNPTKMMRAARVEDYEELGDWEDEAYFAPPHAPSPPRADESHHNVFDFMVDATPIGSTVAFVAGKSAAGARDNGESSQLVRFDHESSTYRDSNGVVTEEHDTYVQYGTGPVPSAFRTPAAKTERRKKDSERDAKKDKKRKRLHIDTRDQEMTDAPPVLHTGLTGGLNRLLGRPQTFPPSPDYSGSGGDVGDTPGSPLKKTKHSRHHKSSRGESIGNNLFSMLTSHGASTKTKSKKRKATSSSSPRHEHRQRALEGSEAKLIEYKRDGSRDEDGKMDESGAMVVFKPRADLFLSFVNKGPDSERGCSVNKALKRFHRERTNMPNSMSKPMEEKELWRSLRLRKNEAGEIVLFCV